MRIRMTKTVQGSLDGETVQKLEAGSAYDTVSSPRGDRLAAYHMRHGVAVLALPARKATPKRTAKKVA